MPGNKTYGTLRCWTHETDVESTDQLGTPVVEKEIDSYLAQWGEAQGSQLGQQEVSGVTGTDGNDHTLDAPANPTFDAASGDTSRGIVVGSGGGSESITDFQLGSALLAEFDYGSCDVGAGTVGSSSVTLDITRTLTNTSGSDQTIAEVGIRASCNQSDTTSSPFLLLRDPLSTAFDVAAGDNTTQEYALEFEV